MNLDLLKDRAGTVLIVAVIIGVILAVFFGGGAFAFALVVWVIGGLALQVLLLAIIADAMVETLNKKEK